MATLIDAQYKPAQKYARTKQHRFCFVLLISILSRRKENGLVALLERGARIPWDDGTGSPSCGAIRDVGRTAFRSGKAPISRAEEGDRAP